MIDVYVSGLTIDCGRQGENLARNIIFELQSLIDTYGEGTATLVYMRPTDTAPYICETTQDDAVLTWTPTSTDTAYSGAGKCELRWTVGEILAKSIVYNTTITPSITADSVVPDPYESWYEALLARIEELAVDEGEIDLINEKLGFITVLANSSTMYPTDAMALAALEEVADGYGEGRYAGYITAANSSILGLSNTPHYFELYVRGRPAKLFIAYPQDSSGVYIRAKNIGDWQTTWTAVSGGGTSGVTSVNGMTGAVVIPTATTSANGLMSSTDKSHLDTVYADYSSALTALGVI